MRYFPLFLDIQDKPVLLVGGGDVGRAQVLAARRGRAHRSPSSRRGSGDELTSALAHGAFVHHAREFAATDIEGAWLVVAATDDRE
jgi:uroporphyrin-III C-methyltransferase/precorrin-2 dehydrogenase/sirohydrochlorin ferrochelatase